MREILQGTSDYIKDNWHDFWYWLWDSLENFIHRRVSHTYCWRNNEGCYTKEGSVIHYIKQRKIAARRGKCQKKAR